MTFDPLTPTTPALADVREALFTQLMDVMGLTDGSWITHGLRPIFHVPVQRISRLLVTLDRDIGVEGWNVAVNQFLSHLVTGLEVVGAGNVPMQGPLLVVCNHPAALDVVILAAAIQRDDLKILASDIPIVQMLPHVAWHTIPVYYDISKRLQTVRSAIRHLEQSGAILIFPRGNVEPDPAVSPASLDSLAGWSPSIELFLRRVPQTITVVAAAWGMLSAGWYKNPIVRLWKVYEQRQKVAEIFQVASQLITGRTPSATPTVKFGFSLSVADLGGLATAQGTLLEGIVERECEMLQSFTRY
jgi:hypothetical protein